jgi:hypothetical protein
VFLTCIPLFYPAGEPVTQPALSLRKLHELFT